MSKWTYEDVSGFVDGLYHCYMENTISKEQLEGGLISVWSRTGWSSEEYDEEVLAHSGDAPGCRRAIERGTN